MPEDPLADPSPGRRLTATAEHDPYDNQPAEGRKENDLKLISALKWKY